MDRKFLKQFGLNDKAIGQILGEYHNSLSQAKEDLEAGYLEEMNALKDTIAEQGGKLDTYTNDLTDMQSQLSQEKINNAKINVLVEYGLDPSIAQYVKGGTAEEIEADVRYLREMFDNKPQEPGPMKSVEPNSLGDDPYTRMIKQMG